MEKGPYYCKNLTNRILKSFSDRVTKQLGWNEVRGFSINIHSMKTTNSGKLAVVGTFKVSSTAPVTFFQVSEVVFKCNYPLVWGKAWN